MTGVRQIELSYLREAARKYIKSQIDAVQGSSGTLLDAGVLEKLNGDIGRAYLVGAIECLRGHFNVHWSEEGHRGVYRSILDDHRAADLLYRQLVDERDELDQPTVRSAFEEMSAALTHGAAPTQLKTYLLKGLQRNNSMDVID